MCVRTVQYNTVFRGGSHVVFWVNDDYRCGTRSPELNSTGLEKATFKNEKKKCEMNI